DVRAQELSDEMLICDRRRDLDVAGAVLARNLYETAGQHSCAELRLDLRPLFGVEFIGRLDWRGVVDLAADLMLLLQPARIFFEQCQRHWLGRVQPVE